MDAESGCPGKDICSVAGSEKGDNT